MICTGERLRIYRKKKLKKKHDIILLKDVESIGIDEVFMGKKFGKKDDNKNELKGYLTIVRGLKSGAVLFVGKGKKLLLSTSSPLK